MDKSEIIDISPSGDGAKWGLTDFYEDFEQELREAIDARKPFEAGWSVKKEIESGHICFDGTTYHLCASRSTDEGGDLFDDAVWALCTSLKEFDMPLSDTHELPLAFGIEMSVPRLFHLWDKMRNGHWLGESYLQSDYEAESTLSGDATFDQIVEELEKLNQETDDASEVNFESLQESIWAFLEDLTDPEFWDDYIAPIDSGEEGVEY
jgi:hypothetical protein